MKRSFKLNVNGNKGMFTCNDAEHPSIYINGGMSQDKLALNKEFVVDVGTIIYMREPGGNRDDVKMEFHAIAIDDNDEESSSCRYYYYQQQGDDYNDDEEEGPSSSFRCGWISSYRGY